MQFFFRRRVVVSVALVALAIATAASTMTATERPEKPKKGFRLFARASGLLSVNQVVCGLVSDGQICVDTLQSSTVPGGFWPKGTNNQYTFNSGISIAGLIGPELPAWAGDTTAAFFFDGGGKQNGEQVVPIYNANNPDDVATWPEYAKVPSGTDAGAAIYDPLLQGQVSASQGDVYFVSWDGNPTSLAGRPHPLGVAVETRGLAWTFPAGNQDIVYFIYTLYNITSVNRADYVNIRPAMQDLLLEKAAEYQAGVAGAFGVQIPASGYSITSAFMDFAADQDVADATSNYSQFNNLFNLAVTYHEKFTPLPGNVFDPSIHAPPFLPGPGFVGTKFLRSPILPDSTQAGTVLAGNTTNRGAFPDPATGTQLYRYISGNLNSAAGDPQCNNDLATTHLCFVNTQPSDARTLQSTGPLELAPGGQATIVVAYLYAAPLATGKCPSIPCPVTMASNPVPINTATPANPDVDAIDSAMGYRGFLGQTVVQDSVRTVPNSLLGKALVAQAIFDSKFLLPFAPTAPEFFLVPGDGKVSILWRPTVSETQGDAYFAIANDPTSGSRYDPSYRKFDVEGYRIYRGRTDSPNSLELVAQFDYDTTTIFDFRGAFNGNERCAPEIIDPTTGLPLQGCTDPAGDTVAFTIPPAGTRFPDSVAYDIVGQIKQVRLPVPGRVELANGTVRDNAGADTLVTGGNSGLPPLANTGVPFAFVDDGSGLTSAPRNNVRYFYAVTAFDVNSFQSGPSSLESQRLARAVVPTRQAANVAEAQLQSGVFGDDGTQLSATPAEPFTIDQETGRFSTTPPATAVGALQGAFAPLIPTLLPSLDLSATIDSVLPRSGTTCGDLGNFRGLCAEFFVTFTRQGQPPAKFRTLAAWPFAVIVGDADSAQAQLGSFSVAADPASAARYGIPAAAGAKFNAGVQATTTQNIMMSQQENQQSRRLYGTAPCATCNQSPGGSRWFEGDNETLNDPTYSVRVGHVTGADSIWTPLSHTDQDPVTPGVQEPGNEDACMQIPPHLLAPTGRQADIEVTWGDAGALTSVRDLTHHVDVPFHAVPQAGYGFVTDNNGNGKIDWADFLFLSGVAEAANGPDLSGFCGSADLAAVTVPSLLVQQPTITPVSFTADVATADEDPAAFATNGQGFGLFINGQQFIFALTGGAFPAAGTKWKLRTYAGIVRTAGLSGFTTNPTGYTYTPAGASPAIPGIQVKFTVNAATAVAATTKNDLSSVHTVPDPYYVTNAFETSTTDKIIKFVNLPTRAIIRIYSSSGVLVRVLTHNSTVRQGDDATVSVLGGEETWDVRNRNNQVVASGVYFYHIESGDARRVGRFTVVNFAQ
jgi:hypothetical protein